MKKDFEQMCRRLLSELVNIKELQREQRRLNDEIEDLNERKEYYDREYDKLSQNKAYEKFWCEERIRNKFRLSTLIVVAIVTALCFLGDLGLCNLFKITSDSLSALICFLPAVLAGSVTFYFMYTKRVNNKEYFQKVLENDSLYQKILQELKAVELQKENISRRYEDVIKQHDLVLSQLTLKEEKIFSLVDTLNLLDGDNQVDSLDEDVISESDCLTRRKIKEEWILFTLLW